MTRPGPDVVVCGRGMPSAGSPLLGIFELDQARALQDAGLDVVYAALDVRSVRHWRRWGVRHHDVDGLPVVELNVPIGRVPRGLNNAVMARLWDGLLAVLVRRHGVPRLLHSHFLPWNASLVSRRGLRRVPTVVTEHWSRLSGDIPADIRALGQVAFSGADRVLAVSSPLTDVIEREFGVSAQVVPDIVDVELFGAVALAEREPGVRLVATGNLISRKNVDGLLRAFAQSAPGDARLVVIGDGEERAALETLAAELGIGERVRFTGRLSREEMLQEYAEATGFALASHAETFGVVWAEALVAGLPVLATRCGGPEDFVGGHNGVLVDDRPEAIAAGLEELCRGITQRQWQPEDLAAGVRSRFSAPAVAEQLKQVYAELR